MLCVVLLYLDFHHGSRNYLLVLPQQVSVLPLEQSVTSLEVADLATQVINDGHETLRLGGQVLHFTGVLSLSRPHLLHLCTSGRYEGEEITLNTTIYV